MMPVWFMIAKPLGGDMGREDALILLAGLTLLLLLWSVYRMLYLHVPDGQVAVVQDVRKGGFAGFWPAGYYMLRPGSKRLMGNISTTMKMNKGICLVYTLDGYEVGLDWKALYRLDPCSIGAELQPSMAKVLLSDPEKMVVLHINACIKKIAARNSLGSLKQADMLEKITYLASQSAADCLFAYGIILEELDLGNVRFSEVGRSHFSPGRTLSRLGEREISNLAVPRPGLLNLPKSPKAPLHILDAVSFENEVPAGEFHISIPREKNRLAEVQDDRSASKLVI